ncbi:MAG: MATE family efflux transporter, partial [Lachnospiraceae bacterium]|nr:MATE family efflux transporter [Lachnospiraceae bacterium]
MNKQAAQFKKMTETPIPTLIIGLSIPTVINMLVTNIYNLVDTAFVGRLGNSASGAVGIVFGYMAIIQAFGFMFGQGGGSIVSRLLGAKDTDNASVNAST